jgi:predicted secreted protein
MGTAVMTGSDFLVLTRESAGETIEVHPGFILYAIFEENPGSTGMSWSYTGSSDVILPDYDAYTPGQREHMVGVPGAHLFALKVVAHEPMSAGEETLVFSLGRHSEPPVDQARFKVRVSPYPR